MSDKASSETQAVLTTVIDELRQQHARCNKGASGHYVVSCPWPLMCAEDVAVLADALNGAGYVVNKNE